MIKTFLNNLNSVTDLRQISKIDLPILAKELRAFIIDIVAAKEGHLGASLGVVELSIALHYVFDTPNDLLVWDVGHQAYCHKILTGRKNIFDTNRQLGGIAGFPKISESVFDAFGVGHSSTSISAMLGMAIASQIKGDFDKNHVAVIGDAALASGMAFEALNHAGVLGANILVVLNDNEIGIDPSVGALKNYFTSIKKNPKNTDNNIFSNLNFNYSGPIDGHDLEVLIQELNRLKTIKGPKFLHVVTTKGKGLQQAEDNQVQYHAPGKFDAITGDILVKPAQKLPPKFQDVFGFTILDLANKNPNIVGITPAMPTGSSLKYMMDVYPERAIDVGIAEQHAVTLAAGMATQGLIVFCTIYSTFLQRAYDQIIHDVCLQNLSVIFCIDRAGLVGEDGPTHHGVFDIAFLRCVPNIIIYAPINEIELQNIMFTAQLGLLQPIAIRYPRGRGKILDWEENYFGKYNTIEIGKAIKLKDGTKIAILSTGTIGNNVTDALAKTDNINAIAHYHFGFIKPLDIELLHLIFDKFKTIVTIEDGCVIGGFGCSIMEFATLYNYKNKIEILGIPDNFVEHGTNDELQKICKIDVNSIIACFEKLLLK